MRLKIRAKQASKRCVIFRKSRDCHLLDALGLDSVEDFPNRADSSSRTYALELIRKLY